MSSFVRMPTGESIIGAEIWFIYTISNSLSLMEPNASFSVAWSKIGDTSLWMAVISSRFTSLASVDST